MLIYFDIINTMFVEFKGITYPNLKDTPILSSSHWCNAQKRNRWGEAPVVRTRLNGVDFVVYENMLFPTQESFAYANLLGHVIKSTLVSRTHPLPFIAVDVGTGVGTDAIGIAGVLQEEIREGQVIVVATDISGAALNIADANAQFNNVAGIQFRKRDILEGVREEFGRADLITSNPPWYPSREAVLKAGSYQPMPAIDGGPDGLEFYQALFEQTKAVLSDNGMLAVRTQSKAWGKVSEECRQVLQRPQTAALKHYAFWSGTGDYSRRTGLLHGRLDLFDIKSGYAAYIRSAEAPSPAHSRKLMLENIADL